eukprot:TRINITY_DN523_c0_g1_i4.p1 TRINITY_DN523_c0_g1~~TRINITY_DN523_c0_g1_i4.p1  ORF type:complete len:6531 (+),score=2152.69 TRINITY_DN523_c0_g1_i4:5046-24638(+)
MHKLGSKQSCVDVRYAQCPVMDVVIAFPGLRSVSRTFGRHPNGFYAITGMLQDWVSTMWLTGESYTSGAASTAPSGGVRVGLIQFGGLNTVVQKTPAGVGESGRLSGDSTQLQQGIQYHESHPVAADEVSALKIIRNTLEKAAGLFRESPLPRKKVMIVLTDGELSDAVAVKTEKDALGRLGVEVFAALIRRFPTSTADDTTAATSLQSLAQDQDHVSNIAIDELPDVLGGLCNPTTPWGALLAKTATDAQAGYHLPCQQYTEQTTCTADKGCIYSGVTLACIDSPCIKHCGEAECNTDPLCAWNQTELSCWKRKVCPYADTTSCTNDAKCEWVNDTCIPRVCGHETEADCDADTTIKCEWKSVQDRCEVKKCWYPDDKQACLTDPVRCMWDDCAGALNSPDACSVDSCGTVAYNADKDMCNNDPHCEWDPLKPLGQLCQRRPCTHLSDERCCVKEPDCEWDVTISPAICSQKYCSEFNNQQGACLNEPKCEFNATANRCVDKDCDDMDQCMCESDPDCFWKSAANGLPAACTWKDYGECPIMDIVILMTASSTMTSSFGRHSHGFFGLTELLRDWLKSLPLSKLPAGATQGSAGTVQVGFVQFAGMNKVGGLTGRADAQVPPASSPGTTGGRISGDIMQLNADLDWHEAAYYGTGTMVEKGMSVAADMFSGTPTDGRKRLLIVVAAGIIYDTDSLLQAKARLDFLGVQTFGIALRRQTASTAADDLTLNSLRSVVTKPEDNHIASIVVDEIEGAKALGGLCSVTGDFGQFVVEAKADTDIQQGGVHKPCNSHGEKSTCNQDPGCVWYDSSLSCQETLCFRHSCSESDCNSDIENGCYYDPNAQRCWKIPTDCAQHTGTPADCEASENCEVDTDGTTCKDKQCNHDNELGCLNDPDPCVWDNINNECAPEPCVAPSEAECAAQGDECVWNTIMPVNGTTESYAKGVPMQAFSKAGTQGYPEDCDAAMFSGSCSCSTVLPGAIVAIADGYAAATDSLACDGCTALLVSAEWNSKTGIMKLSGQVPVSTLLQAIREVTFTTTSDNGQTRRLTWNLGHGYHAYETSHYYMYFPSSVCGTQGCTWTDAQKYCQSDANQILGMRGYLATITSATESKVVTSKTPSTGWIGATDITATAGGSDTWRWVTGPEATVSTSVSCTFPAGSTQCDFAVNGDKAVGTDASTNGLEIGTGVGIGFVPTSFQGSVVYSNWGLPSQPSGLDGKHFAAISLPSGTWRDYDHASGAVSGFVCEWGDIGTACMTHNTFGWKYATSGGCEVKKCTATNRTGCEASPYCEWNSTLPSDTACELKPCAEYPDEVTCTKNEDCLWNVEVAPAMCVIDKCVEKTDKGSCQADGDCMWDEKNRNPPKCVQKDCNEFEKCECKKDLACFWRNDGVTESCVDSRYGECPTLDLIIIIDGSGSMSRSFGRHSNGFFAIIEMLRAWIHNLPLSKEPYTVGLASPLTEKARIGFVQFSGENEHYNPKTGQSYGDIVNSVAVTPPGVGVEGRLSGVVSEIDEELTWHEDNFLMGRTFIAKGLAKADEIFLSNSPQDGRIKVLMMFTDGVIADLEGTANTLAELEAQNVRRFGIVLRREPQITPIDQAAEVALKQVSSHPAVDHVHNLQIDDIPEVLTGLCDPESKWGKILVPTAAGHKPCTHYDEKIGCGQDKGCAWSEVLSSCGDSPCLLHCDEPTCTADTVNHCSWNATTLECWKDRPCVYDESTACLEDLSCKWNATVQACEEQECQATDEANCVSDPAGCEWLTSENRCVETSCKYTDETSCTNHPECEWDTACSNAVCIEKPCEKYSDPTTCKADAKCAWSDAKICAKKPCVEFQDESCCAKQPSCFWDVSQAPGMCGQDGCAIYNTSNCDAVRECMIDPATQLCVPKKCESKSACDCRADADCFMSNSESPHCTEQRYGQCPTMDVVVLIDGGVTTSRQFGRHPNGFAALTTMLREWVLYLPLSNEPAGQAPKPRTEQARVAFVQFAGSASYAPSNERQWYATPPTVGTGGSLSGSLSQLGLDLDDHEVNYLGAVQQDPTATYLLGALQKAVSLFRGSPVDRKKVLIVLADGKLDDKDAYQQAKADLDQVQATVFAAHLRPFTAQGPADKEAETTLAKVATSTEHVKNIQLDELPIVLEHLCDPNHEWGKYVARVSDKKPCTLYTAKDTCNKDGQCVWYDTSLSCGESPCLTHCLAGPCTSDVPNLCTFNETTLECTKEELCKYDNLAECEADSKCQIDQPTQTCIGVRCTHDNEQGCLNDPDPCVWDNLQHTCGEKKCNYDNFDSCELPRSWENCTWNSTSSTCVEKRCQHTTTDECDDDPYCAWDRFLDKCTQLPCTEHGDELTCDRDSLCKWDTSISPGLCLETYCRRHCPRGTCDQGNCDADPQCMSSEKGLACVKKRCDSYDACDCKKDSDCFWFVDSGVASCVDRHYGACPTLDLVLVLDGSLSMSQNFGRHPHGFFALSSALLEWIATLPLSNELASVGAASVAGSRRTRVAVVQFSGQTSPANSAIKTPSGVGSGGRLTGDLDELRQDLEWHQNNFLAAGTYLSQALEMTVSLFQNSPSDGRKRSVIVITDGRIQDVNLLSASRTALTTAQAQVFGVVLRRTDSHTQLDLDAEDALSPITSLPHEAHFVNLVLDDLISDSGPLAHMCDPATEWGQMLAVSVSPGQHQPCSHYQAKTGCNADAGCTWDDLGQLCIDSPCAEHCTQLSCIEDVENNCVTWNGALNTCYKEEICVYDNEDSCSKDTKHECAWNASSSPPCGERLCKHGDEDSCMADNEAVCEWKPTLSSCILKPCVMHTTEDACKVPTECEWLTTPSGHCGMKQCLHTEEQTCKDDVLCQWDPQAETCSPRPCVQHAEEKDCDDDKMCEWDVSAAPGSCQQPFCRKFNEEQCGPQPGCLWDGAAQLCGERTCNKLTNACDCQKDPECYWAVQGTTSSCEEQRYGWCPTLDIVMVIDGSGSMSQSFGRHTHGFHAMIHMLREWIMELPLSGEPSSVGASSTPTGKLRVGFIQFSGLGSNTAPSGAVTGSAQRTPPSVGTGGRLSGDVNQLSSDVTWHEDNFMAQQTFVEEGLNMAVSMFTDSPKDGRTRMLMIITDGAISDTTRLTQSRQLLDQAQVLVFGIVIRRFEAHTIVDQQAEEALKPIVSPDTDDHFVNLKIDEVPTDVLNGLCDPNGKWGRLIAMTSTQLPGGEHRPCGRYETKTSCNTDKGCAWYDSYQSCGNTPCFAHCVEGPCTSDQENNCVWDASLTVCYKKEVCAHTTPAECTQDKECEWMQDGTVCKPKRCVHESQDGCLTDPEGCIYDSLKEVCFIDECTAPVEATCKDLAACEWDTESKVCKRKICDTCFDEPCCSENARYCDWDATQTKCVEKPCVGHATEDVCASESQCSWDASVSPGMCTQEYCSQFKKEVECNLEPECIFDFERCGKMECHSYNTQVVGDEEGMEHCHCESDANCFWHDGSCVDKKFGACPTLDIAVVFSGAKTMSRSFGSYTQGYLAVTQMLRDWVLDLPLSGQSAPEKVTTDHKGMARVALVQFSGNKDKVVSGSLTESAYVTPAGFGQTAGRISGFYPELRRDLLWHESNYAGEDTFLADSLKKAVGMLTANTPVPEDDRKRLIIVISDSPLLDDPMELQKGIAAVKNAEAYILAVVVRPLTAHTTLDIDAEASLLPIANSIINVPVYQLKEKVLDTVCMTTTDWGHEMVAGGTTQPKDLPCNFYTSSGECNKHGNCKWNDDTVTCDNSQCLTHCAKSECEADTKELCMWEPNAKLCTKEKVCAAPDKLSCNLDYRCSWEDALDICNPVKCDHHTEDACTSDEVGCDWSTSDDKCQKKKCTHTNEAACTPDAECVWETQVEECVVKQCTYTAEFLCKGDDRCQWVTATGQCDVRECVYLDNQAACLNSKSCEWDTLISPAFCKPTYCSRWSQSPTDCDLDAACATLEENGAQLCVPKTCKLYGSSKCKCRSDPECFWSNDEDACIGTQYGACASTDITIMFSGAASMAGTFGRHPNGYEALLSKFSDWLTNMPLNGDKYTVPEAQANQQGIRVAFLQFSSSSFTNEMNSAAALASGLTVTSGQLSGSLAELQGDMDYFMPRQASTKDPIYVKPGLSLAADVFRRSPISRKKVLIVVTDGLFDDLDRAKTQLANLETVKVQVFGIVLRRTTLKLKQDVLHEEEVLPLLTADVKDHVAAIPMEDLAGLLDTMCSPASDWGRLILESSTQRPVSMSCVSYTNVAACMADPGCDWSETVLACVQSPCLQHECNQASCNDDPLLDCAWNEAEQACFTTNICESKGQPECDALAKCKWDESTSSCMVEVCLHESEASCSSDPVGCEWDSTQESCSFKQCQHATETVCKADSLCRWVAESTVCAPQRCVFETSEETCILDTRCEWTSSKQCSLVVCAEHEDELHCDADPKCEWYTDASPAVCLKEYCSGFETSQTCEAEPDARCSWNATTSSCGKKDCAVVAQGDACLCNTERGCFWDSTPVGTGVFGCTSSQFGGCPVMDVAVIFSSANSMTAQFGRRQNGYLGLLTMLDDWAKTLPLTGTPSRSDVAPTKGVRLGFVQFSAAVSKTPPSEATGGKLSGVFDEITGDIAWHKKYRADTDVINLAPALSAAHGMLSSKTSSGRKRVVLLILEKEPPIDSQVLTEERNLKSMGVQVYGIVARRFAAHDTADQQAEDALRQLVSEEKTAHLQNFVLDELSTVLDTFCDPHSQFGKGLVGGYEQSSVTPIQPCFMYLSKNLCNKDNACKWNDRLQVCADSSCLTHCSMSKCLEDKTSLCEWDASSQQCFKQPFCQYGTVIECMSDPGCQWTTTVSGDVCLEKECQYTSHDGCVRGAEGCEWQQDETCTPRDCRFTSSEVCLMDPTCDWLPLLEGSPEAWAPCVERPCSTTLTRMECLADERCLYDTVQQVCSPKPCVTYIDESACIHHDECLWNDGCRLKYCNSIASEQACTTDPAGCMWSAVDGCKDVVCEELSNCECTTHLKCSLDTRIGSSKCVAVEFGGCPPMDIAVVFSGSKSMANVFGMHPNGYLGLVEVVREWMKMLPLTSESGATQATGTGAQGGLRLGFIQFATNGLPRKSPPGTGSGGRFSGVETELYTDLDWQERNFMHTDAYISTALDWSSSLFQTTPAERRKVLLLLVDKKVDDSAMLGSVRALLESQNVMTLGVVLRRFQTPTPEDELAAHSLHEIVSEPLDSHVFNIPLDSFKDSFLMQICNPNTDAGKAVLRLTTQQAEKTKGMPCALYIDSTVCESESCQWDDANLRCSASVCNSLCTEQTCTANTGEKCEWIGTFCKKVQECPHVTQAECDKASDCFWYKTLDLCSGPPCTAETEDSCRNDKFGCLWDETLNSKAGGCLVDECLVDTETDCAQKPDCVWESVSSRCVGRPCAHTDETKCAAHFECKWDNNNCVVTDKCALLPTGESCLKDPDCEWNIEHSPARCTMRKCLQHGDTQQDCESSASKAAGCVWYQEGGQALCAEGRKICVRQSEKCSCASVTGCSWDDEGHRCFPTLFRNCEPLDVVIMLDGSSLMDSAFGRHPVGYYGLLEMVKEWTESIPLTQEPASTGSASVAVKVGMRVGYIQFSKHNAASAGKVGRLSGSVYELTSELTHHADNKLGTADHYLAGGMAMAATMFADSPYNRKKVLLILTAGSIDDADLMTSARSELDTLKVQVFGVGLRRTTTPVTSDAMVDASVQPLVSDPLAGHYTSLTLEDVRSEVFDGFCSEDTMIGYYVVEHGKSVHKVCGSWETEPECGIDSACTWRDGMCTASVCPTLCEEKLCTDAAETDSCTWSADDHSCSRFVCEYTTQEACEANSLCWWDKQSEVVGQTDLCKPAVGCHGVSNPAECEAVDACAWETNTGKCNDKRKCSVYFASDRCNADTACAWNSAAGMCEDKDGCRILLTQQNCGDQKACMWYGDTCIDRTCGAFESQQACDAESVCEWDAAAGSCSTKFGCVRHEWDDRPEVTCLNDPLCMWTYSKQTCEDLDGCPKHQSAPDCAVDPSCEWVTASTPNGDIQKCVESGCVALQNPSECSGNTTCEWFDFTGVPRCDAKCSLHSSQEECKKVAICEWSEASQTCEASNGCYLKNEEADCNELPQCGWDRAASECTALSECKLQTTEPSCNTSAKCVWSEAQTCVPQDQCFFYRDQSLCNDNKQGDQCEWLVGENRCVPVTTSVCPTLTDQKTCASKDICEWVSPDELCRAKCSPDTCKNGVCQDGCCVCDAGYTGTECNRCALFDADGECAPTCTEAVCSYHGTCDSFGGCVCQAGWTGAFCNVRACTSTSPNFVTTYRLRPLKNEPFTIILHGCFDTHPDSTSRKVKIVPEDSDCAQIVTPQCVAESGDTELSDTTGCGAVTHLNATVEPKGAMELLVNTTYFTESELDKKLRVCWLRSNFSGEEVWVPVSSHEDDGSFTDVIIVRAQPTEDVGSIRGAPLSGGDICCEGLRIGELCLPAALVVIIWVLLLAALFGICFLIARSRRESETLDAKETAQKYDGFEMEDGTQRMVNEAGASNNSTSHDALTV